MKEKKLYTAWEALHPTTAATTVRVWNGETLTTNGPFAETKEQPGGFYVLDCKDLDAAIEYAAKIPSSANGCIEIRPIVIWQVAAAGRGISERVGPDPGCTDPALRLL